MTSRDFCYWLQGFFEINESSISQGLTPIQAGVVQKHLGLVFAHEIDPSQGGSLHQQTLNAIHNATDPNAPRPRC